MRYLVGILALAALAAVATAQSTATTPKPAPRPVSRATPPLADQPDETGLYNASLRELGATANGSGAPFNKDWPPDNTLVRGRGVRRVATGCDRPGA